MTGAALGATETPTAAVPWALWQAVGFRPHSGQLDDLAAIHLALEHGPGAARFLDVTTGRQYGKTTEAAVTVLEGALQKPDDYGPPVVKIVADTYEHTNLIWDKVEAMVYGTRLRELIDTSKPGKGYDRERWILYLKSGATIQKLSSDRPQSLTGHTATLVVIDEKAFVSDAALEMLLPCLAVRQGVIVAFGTAEGTGWGRTWHFRGEDSDYPEHWSATHPSTDNPFMPLEEMESQRRMLPERRFRQLWLAEWVSDDGQVFHNIEGCVQRHWPEEWAPEPGRRYVAGLDLARYSDYTALIVADKDTKRCVYRERMNLMDWSSQAARIAATAKRYNNARVWADATHGSVGDPVVEMLRKQYDLDVQPYGMSVSTKAPLVDKLVWSLEREELRFPPWKDLVQELQLYEAKIGSSGRVILGAPSGFHDDLVVALALCNYGMTRGAMAGIKVPRQRAPWEGF